MSHLVCESSALHLLLKLRDADFELEPLVERRFQIAFNDVQTARVVVEDFGVLGESGGRDGTPIKVAEEGRRSAPVRGLNEQHVACGRQGPTSFGASTQEGERVSPLPSAEAELKIAVERSR